MSAKRSGRNNPRVPTATKPIITAGDNNTPDSTSHAADTRPRCAVCRHPLTAHRSIARGCGRVCWTRTQVGRLDRARDALGRDLTALASRVALLDGHRLGVVSSALAGLRDALRAEAEVAS